MWRANDAGRVEHEVRLSTNVTSQVTLNGNTQFWNVWNCDTLSYIIIFFHSISH